MPDSGGPYSVSETVLSSGPWSVARATDADGRAVRLTTLRLPDSIPDAARAALVATLEHGAAARGSGPAPGLLAVLGCGEKDGFLYLAEAAPSGPSVREAVSSHGPMAPEQLVPFLHQVAAALETLHTASLTHVWLSPDNVYLEQTAQVGGQAWSAVMALMGSIAPAGFWPESAFAAPEALAGGAPDARAEVFSAAALGAFATGQAPSPDMVPAGLPPALQAALARGLQTRPEARYCGVKEMVVDVTVEQAIAMQDAADQVAVPSGGEVPDWARDLLQQTAARREAGQPLLGEAPAPAPTPAPVPAPGQASATTSGPASALPPPMAVPGPSAGRRPAQEDRSGLDPREDRPSARSVSVHSVEVEPPEASTRKSRRPEAGSAGFDWSEGEHERSWMPTIVIAMSVLFIFAALALTLMKR